MKFKKHNLSSINRERREFLKSASAGTAILLTMGFHGWSEEIIEKQPLHPGLLLPGIYGYPNEESVEAGQLIKFHISSTGPYQATICKLGKEIDEPNGDIVLFKAQKSKGLAQPIHPGSYIYVAKGLNGTFENFSAEGWIKPWKVDKNQVIVSQEIFRLQITPLSGLEVKINDETLITPPELLKPSTWHYWAFTKRGKVHTLYLDGKEVQKGEINHKFSLKAGPLTIGTAINQKYLLEHFIEADMASIKLYDTALTPEKITESFNQKGIKNSEEPNLLAHWNFDEEKGDQVKDHSKYKRNGKIINHGTWMVGGPSFTYEVDRFKKYSPESDPTRGHGFRFSSDDLYDCEWEESFEYKIPENAKPGFYVARLWYDREGAEDFYDIIFIVRRSEKSPPAPMLVIAATNTWRAYNGAPFAVKPLTLKNDLTTGGGKNHPLEPPAYCFYRKHAAGQGTLQLGSKIPWPAAGPFILYGSDYSHLMRGERYTHLWLDQEGYNYDVITDTDLHKNPEILKKYKVFIINGHSEYWSLPMYQGLENFLNENGKLIVLSGNSLFWRVSFNEDCSILECRKVDAPGEQIPAERRGEAYHSQDKIKGGLLRETEWPGYKLIGLDILGWVNSGLDEQFGPYIVQDEDHFLFNYPEKTGLKKGDAFALSPGGKLPGVNGHEIDIRLSTFKKLQEKEDLYPFPEEPKGITTIANGKINWKGTGKEGEYLGETFDYYMRTLKKEHEQGADVIFWERPEGGQVFNAGAIRSGWALYTDPHFQKIIKNVLHHYGVTV